MIHSPEILELYDEAGRHLVLAFVALGAVGIGAAYLVWRVADRT